MTGFGKASARFGSRTITVAIKSLNSKQADLSSRIASIYREGELELRSLITDRLQRGKIDLTITMEDDALEGNTTPINKEALLGYVHQLQTLRRSRGWTSPLTPSPCCVCLASWIAKVAERPRSARRSGTSSVPPPVRL